MENNLVHLIISFQRYSIENNGAGAGKLIEYLTAAGIKRPYIVNNTSFVLLVITNRIMAQDLIERMGKEFPGLNFDMITRF